MRWKRRIQSDNNYFALGLEEKNICQYLLLEIVKMGCLENWDRRFLAKTIITRAMTQGGNEKVKTETSIHIRNIRKHTNFPLF